MKMIVLVKIGVLFSVMLFTKLSLEARHKVLHKTPPLEWTYRLDSYGDPFDPLSYVPYEDTLYPSFSCPGTASNICIIEVSTDEIYEPTDIPIPAYWWKPKVNSGLLEADITAALAAAVDPYISGTTGRVVWKRY